MSCRAANDKANNNSKGNTGAYLSLVDQSLHFTTRITLIMNSTKINVGDDS